MILKTDPEYLSEDYMGNVWYVWEDVFTKCLQV